MTTVAYASSVRPNVNVMLLPGQPHSSKEEEKLTPQLVSVRHLQRHVAILSQRERLSQLHCYLRRHRRPCQRTKTVSGKRLTAQATETEVRSDKPKIHLMIREPPARMSRKWSDHQIL